MYVNVLGEWFGRKIQAVITRKFSHVCFRYAIFNISSGFASAGSIKVKTKHFWKYSGVMPRYPSTAPGW